jgi:hypothetical protein
MLSVLILSKLDRPNGEASGQVATYLSLNPLNLGGIADLGVSLRHYVENDVQPAKLHGFLCSGRAMQSEFRKQGQRLNPHTLLLTCLLIC